MRIRAEAADARAGGYSEASGEGRGSGTTWEWRDGRWIGDAPPRRRYIELTASKKLIRAIGNRARRAAIGAFGLLTLMFSAALLFVAALALLPVSLLAWWTLRRGLR
jgi:hypothetical protein